MTSQAIAMPPMSTATSAARLVIDVEDRDLGAGLGQHARRRGAEPGSAAGDDRGMSTDVHLNSPV